MYTLMLIVTVQTVILAILAMQIHGLRKMFDVVPYPEEAQTTDERKVPADIIDVQNTLSEFDQRIARFQEELNTPTYEDNVAQTLHPDVYNVPHASVTETSVKYEEEYSQ